MLDKINLYYKNIGVDVGGTKMHMLAIDSGKHIESTVPTGINATKEYIKEQITKFIKTLSFNVEGIGVALPGLVKGSDFLISSGLT